MLRIPNRHDSTDFFILADTLFRATILVINRDLEEMHMARDMTKGNITGHLIAYAVPLVFGNLFQQLYQ